MKKLTIEQTGYGHWKVTTNYYNKDISAIITNAPSIDDYRSDDERRSKRGAKELRRLVILKNYYTLPAK